MILYEEGTINPDFVDYKEMPELDIDGSIGLIDGRSIKFNRTSIVSDIYGNKSSITQNATDIALNVTDIGGNTSNIDINASGISTNVTDISGNATNIDINASGISTNVTDISGNASNISQNATNISLRILKHVEGGATDEILSEINLSEEAITINATKISIGGTTTFASGWASATNAESDITGSNIDNDSGWTDNAVANSKAKTFRQTTAPASGMSTGDIWIDINDGDRVYTYNGSGWAESLTIIDGGHITTGTLDASVVNVTNLSATNISAGTLNVDRISAGSIVAGKVGTDLTDSNISSINFDNITASNINAGNIKVGTSLSGWTLGTRTLKSVNEKIELDAGDGNSNLPHIKVFSEGSSNPNDYAQLTGGEDPNQVNVGIPRFDVYRDTTETDGNVRTQYGKVLWFYTKYQTVAYDPCPQVQMWTKDGKEYNEEFGAILPNDKDGISIWALHMKSDGDGDRVEKAQIQMYASSTVSGTYKGDIILGASTVTSGGAVCNLGDYNAKWAQLYLSQLASNPSAPYLVEGLVFTKTDHHIYYYNGSSAIALDSSGGISAVVDDTSPELGGDLDASDQKITNVTYFQGHYLNSYNADACITLGSTIYFHQDMFPSSSGSIDLGSSTKKYNELHAQHIYSTSTNEFLDLTNTDGRLKQNLICYTDINKNIGDSTHRFASVFGQHIRTDEIDNNSGTKFIDVSGSNIDCFKPLILNELANDPTASRGMIYFNTTLSKIKVCVDGTNWETVTSA